MVLLHLSNKVFVKGPYSDFTAVSTFNSVPSIVSIKNHYIKQILH